VRSVSSHSDCVSNIIVLRVTRTNSHSNFSLNFLHERISERTFERLDEREKKNAGQKGISPIVDSRKNLGYFEILNQQRQNTVREMEVNKSLAGQFCSLFRGFWNLTQGYIALRLFFANLLLGACC